MFPGGSWRRRWLLPRHRGHLVGVTVRTSVHFNDLLRQQRLRWNQWSGNCSLLLGVQQSHQLCRLHIHWDCYVEYRGLRALLVSDMSLSIVYNANMLDSHFYKDTQGTLATTANLGGQAVYAAAYLLQAWDPVPLLRRKELHERRRSHLHHSLRIPGTSGRRLPVRFSRLDD